MTLSSVTSSFLSWIAAGYNIADQASFLIGSTLTTKVDALAQIILASHVLTSITGALIAIYATYKVVTYFAAFFRGGDGKETNVEVKRTDNNNNIASQPATT